MRIPLEGLATQSLLSVTTSSATYVGMNVTDPILEATPTVLVFSASRLCIENPFQLQSLAELRLEDLIGESVVEAYSTPEELVIVFTGATQLVISLRDDDYTTPEAASFEPNTGPIVVFN